MREIKFRAWDKIGKQIINGVTVYHPADHIGIGSHEAPEYLNDDSDIQQSNIEYGDDWIYIMSDFVLMQYTGLKDKNGVEIYEGDIICYENDYPYALGTGKTSADINNDIGEIYWNDEMSCFSVKSGKNAREQIDIPLWQLLDEYGDFEIIGNVFENKELLNDS